MGDVGVEQYCRKEKIPILMTIPLDKRIASLYSCGVGLVEGLPHWQAKFVELYRKIKECLNERNRGTEW